MEVHSEYVCSFQLLVPPLFSFLPSVLKTYLKKHENEDEPCVYFSPCCMFFDSFIFSYSFKHFHKFYFPNKFAACVFSLCRSDDG